jgi:hypothetical protein
MKMRMTLLAGVLALAAFLPLERVGAKNPPDRIVIVGPDWFGEIEVTDPEALQALGPSVFEEFDRPAESMDSLQRGYLLTRGFVHDGVFHPWDRVIYFADPSGSRGLVYYLEIVDGFGPNDGKWYYVSEQGEAAIQEIFSERGVRPPELVQTEVSNVSDGLLIGAGLALFLFGNVSGFLFGRRQRRRVQSPR